jgi:hypothetical protein
LSPQTVSDVSIWGRNAWNLPIAAAVWRGGVVVGSSDAKEEVPQNTPLGRGDVLATIYSALGIDFRPTFPDFNGRPAPVLPQGTPIKALF